MPAGDTGGAVQTDQPHWTARPALALGIRALSVALPLIASWLAVRTVASSLWRPAGWVGLCAWILQAAVVATAVSVLVERGTRRLLPLSTLFSLSLAFPDEVPSRFAIALRSGSAASRRNRIRTIRRDGLGDDLSESPARALELLTLLNMHDRRTRGHSERVRAYSVLIGEEMGLPAADLDLLSWAALLHDIGKIDVPADILNSPGEPSQVEWKILQGHPTAGEEFLAPLVPWLGPWIGAANDHHERWDGSGYPNQLAGTDISLAGRIVAVADAYDVMTSKRSYKRAASAAAARRELIRSSSSQLDPAVVRAFLNISLGRRPSLGPFAWLFELPFRSSLAGTPMTPLVAGAVVLSSSFGAPAVSPETLALQLDSAEVEARPVTADSWTVTEALVAGRDASPAGSMPTPGDETSEVPAPATTTTVSPSTTITGVPTTPDIQTTSSTLETTTSASGAPTTTTSPVPSSSTTTTTSPVPSTSMASAATSSTTTTAESGWARADTGSAVTGTQLQIWVLDNDTPPGAFDFESLMIVDSPPNGSVSIYSPGGSPMAVRLRYRSSAGFTGQDQFIYQICDVDGVCARATVTVTVS